jgi:hypothetical protein
MRLGTKEDVSKSKDVPRARFAHAIVLQKREDQEAGLMHCRMQAVFATVIAVVAIATTAISAPGPFSYGLIQRSCAPWDGAAIGITLTTGPAECKRTSEPFISIGVWRGLPVKAGQVVKFAPDSDAGFASRCKKEGDCVRAQSGTITFDRYEEGSVASGHYELHFKGEETLSGTFDVKWCHERVMCG